MPKVRLANLRVPADGESLVRLLNEYASDPMGRGTPLDADVCSRLAADLAGHPSAYVYLAEAEGAALGLAVCFLQYSTFGGFHLMNIHDFIVSPSARGRGLGRLLLRAVCDDAAARGCRKVTLEVRHDNQVAQELYRSESFVECSPPMYFWQRLL